MRRTLLAWWRKMLKAVEPTDGDGRGPHDGWSVQ